MQYFFNHNHQTISLRPATEADLDTAAAICDECVGQNLYPKERILEAIHAEDQFFYLLDTQDGESAGYLFFLLCDLESIARSAKVDRAQLETVCKHSPEVVSRLQSIGLRKPYRSGGLAEDLIRFVLQQSRQRKAEIIYTVCWKKGSLVPLARSLQECGFSFLMEAEKVWYDEEQLYCPHCHGRCHCDAQIYYKPLL